MSRSNTFTMCWLPLPNPSSMSIKSYSKWGWLMIHGPLAKQNGLALCSGTFPKMQK